MKKLLAGVMMTAFTALAYENCTVDGVSWNYSVSDGKATIELSDLPNVESIMIPDALGGFLFQPSANGSLMAVLRLFRSRCPIALKRLGE